MFEVLKEFWFWSEVWAFLIPLAVLWKHRKQPTFMKPVIIYVVLALVIDLILTIGFVFKDYVKSWLPSNNYLYNIHSVVRFIFLSSFFNLLNQPFLVKIKKLIPYAAGILLIINFLFFEDFFEKESFSSVLLATECALLLFYCLQYYLFLMQQDSSEKRGADFWVVLGLSVYVVFNFPYFLLYTTLLNKSYVEFAMSMWNFHNVTLIILCIFIAKAFYVSGNK